MLAMDENTPQFKDKLFAEFLEWEKTQPKKRSSVSAFARWLSNNSSNTEIKQQNVDSWISGAKPKDFKFISVLAEKLGNWVFDALDITPPNPYLNKLNRLWEHLPEDVQKRLAEEAEIYETENVTSANNSTPKTPSPPAKPSSASSTKSPPTAQTTPSSAASSTSTPP